MRWRALKGVKEKYQIGGTEENGRKNMSGGPKRTDKKIPNWREY